MFIPQFNCAHREVTNITLFAAYFVAKHSRCGGLRTSIIPQHVEFGERRGVPDSDHCFKMFSFRDLRVRKGVTISSADFFINHTLWPGFAVLKTGY